MFNSLALSLVLMGAGLAQGSLPEPTPSPSPSLALPGELPTEEGAPVVPSTAPSTAPSPAPAPGPAPARSFSPAPAPAPAPPSIVAPPSAMTTKDTAADLEVSRSTYYQKYLGRIRPDGDAYRNNYPIWALFFGVWPIPVFPMEGDEILESIQAHIETGRFETLKVERGSEQTIAAVASHIEAVALKRAEVEAAQEGRYNADLKGMDIYAHHLEAVQNAGYAYHLRLDEVAVLADSDLSRFVANAEATITLYKVHLGQPPRGEIIGTLKVGGAGVSLNVLQFMSAVDPTPEDDLRLAIREALGHGMPLESLGAGGTLAGTVVGREIALQRAVRNLLADLDVKLSQVEGFGLEAPVESLKGRKVYVNLGTFEGLELDQAFELWVVSPKGTSGCPEDYPDSPVAGACGRSVGFAKVRDIGDNVDPKGGRLTPEREAIDVITGASEGARVEPYFSELQLLIKDDLPPSTLGLKVYEARQAGRGISFGAGLGTSGPALEITYRRSISDLIPIPELSLETAFALKPGTSYAGTIMLGPTKRVYVGRFGAYLGGRAGLGAALEGCNDCRLAGVEGVLGAEVLLSPRWSLTAGATSWRLAPLAESGPLISGTSVVAGVAILW